jgi:hypothetical protein
LDRCAEDRCCERLEHVPVRQEQARPDHKTGPDMCLIYIDAAHASRPGQKTWILH